VIAALIQCGGRPQSFSAREIASTGEPTTTPPLFHREEEW
jgi:hypothetical protein